MRVRDIMTEPPLTCTPETTLSAAARLMRDADYGTLPVLDLQGRLVGIITDRDICLAVANTTRNASDVAVHAAMTRNVFSVLLDDDVHSALAVMKSHRVRRLPVRDESGRLKGIVSIEDLVVRGPEGGGLAAEEIIDALRTMYARTPVIAERGQTKD